MLAVLLPIILAGLLSVAYGAWATKQLMAADAGTERMQEIATAIREGAQAYLKRQYTTIAGVGIVIFFIGWFLLGILPAIGFAHRRDPLGCGRLHRHERVGAGECAHRPGRDQVAWARGLSIAFMSGAITGLLVAGLALLGVAVYFGFLTAIIGYDDYNQPHRHRRAGGAGLRRIADLHLCPSRRRYLHQGCRRGRRSRGQGRGRNSRRTIRATPPRLPTTSATMSATAPAWQPTCSRPMS
jgi:Na+/H+-translocating membrane pyrophosphatase